MGLNHRLVSLPLQQESWRTENLSKHAGMELLLYGNKCGRAAKYAQNVPKKVSVDCIKCPCQINEGHDGLDAVHDIFPFVAGNKYHIRYINIYIIYRSKSLYVVQSLYFGSKLPSSGTYK